MMAECLPMPPSQLAMVSHAPLLVLGGLYGLMLCLAGYLMYRPAVALGGLASGIWLGAAILTWRMPTAGAGDAMIACVVLGGLLGLAGWYATRGVFALLAGFCLAWFIVHLAAQPDSAWWWVLGIVTGLALAVISGLFVRPMFLHCAGLIGAFLLIFCIAAAWAGGSEPLLETLRTRRWLMGLFLLIAIPVGLLGVFIQRRLAKVFLVSSQPPRRPRLTRR